MKQVTDKPDKRPKRSSRLGKLGQLTKKQLIIAAAITVIAVLIALSATSYISWQRYHEDTTSRQQEITATTRQLVAMDSLTLDQMRDYKEELSTKLTALCDKGIFAKLYAGIASSAKGFDRDCHGKKQQYQELEAKAADLVAYLEADQKLGQLLKAIQSDLSKIDDGKYQLTMQRWQKANDELKKLEVIDGYQPVVDSVSAAAAEITKAYQAIIKADKEQKRIAFDDAVVEISNAHAKLRDSQSVVSKVSQQLVGELSELARIL